MTAPDGTVSETWYAVDYNPADPDFNTPRPVVYSIDANRRFVRRAVDVFGNLRVVSESTGSWPVNQPNPTWDSEYRTRYTYDVAGRLTQVRDHANNQTTLTYDRLGCKTQMVDPDMGTWTYGYDAAGNLIRQTDAKNTPIVFEYDGLNRLTHKWVDWGLYSFTLARYYYDEAGYGASLGRRTRAVAYNPEVFNNDITNTIGWSYDLRGRTTQETKVISGTGGGVFTTVWGYDSADRLLTQTYPDGEVVTTTYTAEGLPKTLIGKNTYVGDTVYTALGQVDLRRLGSVGGVITTDYIYRTDNFRLQWLKSGTSAPFESLQKLEYAYDAVGNVDWIKDWRAGSPQMQDYTYDALHRLTGAVATGGSSGTYTEGYAYNEIGNLVSKTGVGSYAYGAQAADCPEGALSKPHAAVTAGSNTYCYDQNGNMRRRKLGASTYTLTYDAENRLTGVSGAATASYVYDGDGRRVKSTSAARPRPTSGTTSSGPAAPRR